MDFLIMMWDGLNFFTFEHHKLDRVAEGRPQQLCDKFKDKQWLS